MVRKQIVIVNKLGLHARAAAKFVTLASEFHSAIEVRRGEKCVNGKSIMGLMMLAAAKGVAVEITADGHDEAQALFRLEELIMQRFGEED
ncbi:MAG TPA: HPr family phosphocarrier protein [Gammaproteobacteria bacterium]|nr:HPr family phosphocarrier protein [Gammaproteobacteria bacterium]